MSSSTSQRSCRARRSPSGRPTRSAARDTAGTLRLRGLRGAIARRPALEHVGDVDVAGPAQAERTRACCRAGVRPARRRARRARPRRRQAPRRRTANAHGRRPRRARSCCESGRGGRRCTRRRRRRIAGQVRDVGALRRRRRRQHAIQRASRRRRPGTDTGGERRPLPEAPRRAARSRSRRSICAPTAGARPSSRRISARDRAASRIVRRISARRITSASSRGAPVAVGG